MALHCCRDFLSWANPMNMYAPYVAHYLLTIFMRSVLGYTVVGQTNWNIDGATYRFGTGNNGSMNLGPGPDVYAFAPNGYAVSSADIGRILAVKSPGFPLLNSGLFRITSVNTLNNSFYINYRSSDTPPPETGMTWAVYENETVFNAAVTNGGNGIVNTYQTQGTANASRIIMQSPSGLGWQVRFCSENIYDLPGGGGSVTPSPGFGAGSITTAPGFGGNAVGDFPVGGQHLHTVLFFNIHNTQYQGSTVGFFPNSFAGNASVARYYMWGDDGGGAVFAAARSGLVGGADSMVHFGLPEDEEQPLPPHPAQRLFVFGANALGNFGQNGIYWACGSLVARNGVAFGLSNQPISCIYSLYNPLANVIFRPGNTNARAAQNQGDNPYINATELISVDLVAGTQDNMGLNGGPELMILEGRRLGRAPLVRMGRTLAYFQPTTDPQHSWLHLNDGIYLPWQGATLP